MTPDERIALCEKYKLGVHWDQVDAVWIVEQDILPFDYLAQASRWDTAIDLAASRLAERGLL